MVLGLCPSQGIAEEAVPAEPKGDVVVVEEEAPQDEGQESAVTQGEGDEDEGTLQAQSLEPVTYIDENGDEQTCSEYTVLDESTTDWSQAWYVVKGTVLQTSGIVLTNGDTHIILCDGASLTTTYLEYWDPGNITIYGQAEGTGTLNASAQYAPIYVEEGDVVINGGTVNSNSSYSSGIYDEWGDIIINGGTVSAHGPDYGLYTDWGDIKVNGGEVTAVGDGYEGICAYGSFTVNGGEVTASCNGWYGTYSYYLYMNGGTLNASGTKGIYASFDAFINGGTVTASGTDSYGIHAKNLAVAGGEVTADGTESGIYVRRSLTLGELVSVEAGEDEANATDVTSTFAKEHDQKWVHTEEGAVAVTGVALNKTATVLPVSGMETLTATVSPGNATDKSVTWSSDNTAVATVEDGVVTAVAVGTANITVTTADGGKTATCAVTVAGDAESEEPADDVTVAKAARPSTVARPAKSSIDVTWKAVSGAETYQVQWRAAGGKWTTKSVAGSSLSITGLKRGTAYQVRVRGVNGSTEGAWSKASCRWLQSASKVKVAAGKKSGTVKVSWAKLSKANGGFKVYVYAKKGGKAVKVVTVAKGKTSATVKGLKAGKTYYVRVRPYRTVSGTTFAGAVSSYRAVKAAK